MMKSTAFRRLTAWTLSLLLALAQVALPVAALAQDMTELPIVTIYYQYSEEESPEPVIAANGADSLGAYFWATLPEEAFGFPITLSIQQPETAWSFDPPDGTALGGENAIDLTGGYTMLTAFDEQGNVVASYRLYLSSMDMPAPDIAPASVPVQYVDADNPGNVLYSEYAECYYGQDNYVYANAGLLDGYTLEGADSQLVTVDEYGNASPAGVTFTFRRQAVKARLTVYYTDVGGNELANPVSMELEPGDHTISPDYGHVPAGYVLADTCPETQTVTVYNDGTISMEAVVFEFAEYVEPTEEPTEAPTEAPTEEPEPTDEPTDEPYVEPSDEPYVEPSEEPTEAPTEVPTLEPVITLEPQQEPVNRYAHTNKSANFRTEASTQSKKAFADVSKDTYVWVYGTFEVANDKGKLVKWAAISYNGTDCFVWDSLIDTLSQEDSDAYNYAQPTAVPGTETEAPTATPEPTEEPTEAPTDTPEPTDAPTPTPTATPSTVQKSGYYLTLADVDMTQYYDASNIYVATVPEDSVVQVIEAVVENSGREWDLCTYDNTYTGYVDASYLREMTQEEIDAYLATPTPAPTDTSAPTDEPTEAPTDTPAPTDEPTEAPTDTPVPTDEPTDAPTATPTQAPTATPTTVPTEEPDMYTGYAVTAERAALRSSASMKDASIIATLSADTLLYVNGQGTKDAILWSSVITWLGQQQYGLMPDSALIHISDSEARQIISEYEKAHQTPTPSPVPTPIPVQVSGYFKTIGENVPLRTVTSVYANAIAFLPFDTVVYVNGQLYNEGYGWHQTNYGTLSGYIRQDQLQQMTEREVQEYLKANATPSPTPNVTAQPYDPYAPSSYGYVNAGSVNFRSTPGGSKLKTLQRYAFALILGSRNVNGTTWYNINQAGTIGWVSGQYFKVLNLTELTSFLNSAEYRTGLLGSGSSSGSSSSGSGSSSGGSSGSASQGNVSSVEDWNLGVWQSGNTGTAATYPPFNPNATPSASVEPSTTPGDGTGTTATPTPSPTFEIGTMIPIDYSDESKETQSGSGWLGFAIGGVVLLGGAGGVYAYALNQNKRRKAAARAAAASRRGTTGTTGATGASTSSTGSTASPYARRAVAAPPYAGTQQASGTRAPSQTNPYAQTPTTGKPNPYATPTSASTSTSNPYAAPTSTSASSSNPYAAPTSTSASASNSYAAPTSTSANSSNPYAAPTSTSASASNPYAAPTSTGTSSSNPYAAPTSTSASASNPYAAPTETDATHHRTSRAARHQSNGDNNA